MKIFTFLKMYNKSFRNSISITKKLFTTKCKFVNSKFTIPGLIYCINRSMLIISRCHSTNLSQSAKTIREYNEKYKKQLENLLQDPEKLAEYQKLQMEVEFYRHNIMTVPEVLNPYDWLVLMEATSKNQKRQYLIYRWKNEMKHEREILGKKEMQEEWKRLNGNKLIEGPRQTNYQKYGLHDNTMFLRIYNHTMNNYYTSQLMNAMLYGMKVVFDFSYDHAMAKFEANNCAKQLVFAYVMNRIHNDPFDLYFCNANKSNYVIERVHRVIPTLYEPDFPLNITEKSYMEIFDPKKLVYLTPHTNSVMTKFNPDSIYIIGAMVDKVNRKPLSLGKAKEAGIRALSLPISQYLNWGSGSSKNLPLNQVLGILLDLKCTNNWKTALKHVPTRKLKEARDDAFKKNFIKRQQMISLLENAK